MKKMNLGAGENRWPGVKKKRKSYCFEGLALSYMLKNGVEGLPSNFELLYLFSSIIMQQLW